MQNKIASVIAAVLLKSAFFFILLLLLNHCWRRRWLYYYGAKIPGFSGLPFLGTVNLFFNSNELYYRLFNACKQFKPIGKCWIGSYLAVITSDPEHVSFLTKKCLGKPEKYNCIKDVVGEGLITAPVEKWKSRRNIINKTFKLSILRSYVHIFVKYADKLMLVIKRNENKPINILELFQKCTFAIIHESCMGVDWSNTREYAEYMKNVEKALKLTFEHLVYPLYQIDLIWNLSAKGKLDKICKDLFNHNKKVLKHNKNKLQNHQADQENFLNRLIKLSEENGDWTEKDLIDEIQTMIIAGGDTSSVTLSFVSILLALHPEIQEKMFEEQTSIFEDGHDTVTLEDINKMKYLERVIKETLRLFPLAPYISRGISEDIQIENYTLPKGTTWIIPIAFIHRDPSWWPDPLEFDPDRFSPELSERRPQCSFLPFGVAPRNCIGFKFAYLSMKVILSKMIRQYKITWTQYKSVEDIKLEINTIVRAKYGYNVRLTPRC